MPAALGFIERAAFTVDRFDLCDEVVSALRVLAVGVHFVRQLSGSSRSRMDRTINVEAAKRRSNGQSTRHVTRRRRLTWHRAAGRVAACMAQAAAAETVAA